ncbi:SpoIID/LytB domain-containing protein [Wukongibacter baidiensis]|uniref:SpoIID/LytB domain-containing protein n=1 Tax=Wukongibacter baidiensis TaxID=1723361 RepID=UPI003D7F2CEF
MKKRIYILYCLILVLLLSTSVSLGFDKSNLPQRIKVGLRYGDKAASVVSLSSTSGFDFGYYNDNGFNDLFTLMDVEDITIRKDGYYKKLNNSYIETYSDNAGESAYGPYHVQVGGGFESRVEMQEFLDAIDDRSTYYPVYDDGWQIWAGLFISKEQAQEFANSNEKINDKNLKVVKPNNGRVVVLSKKGKVLFIYNSSQRQYNFRPFIDKDGNDIISVDGKRFRGEIIISRYSDSDMTVINYLNLDEYLYGVLPKEMSGDWPLEALKAQAVAARNFAVANMDKHMDHGFNMCSTIDCQVYGGYDIEKPRSNMAVDETTGKILTYDGKIVSAFFHSNSGGRTEDSENIWGISLPYIKGVEDQFSLGAPHSTWTKVYSPEEIKNVLNANGMSIGDIKAIYPEGYSENGRVLSLKISDGSKEVELVKEKTRALFGYYDIKSMYFNLSSDSDLFVKSSDMSKVTRRTLSNVSILSANDATKTSSSKTYKAFDGVNYKTISGVPTKYIFNGKGWGHGLGMSQWGAKKMAELGYTYEDILLHYYTGTTIE